MEKKEDRRVLYTKMFLKEALLSLMKEKPVDRITPTELCRTAGINRNTFYSHYYTVRDLLQSVEDDLEGEIIQSLMTKLSKNSVLDLLFEVCETLYKQKELCKILLSDHGDKAFLEKVIGMGKNFIVADWRSRGMDISEDTCDMIFCFVVDGSLSVLRQWAKDDMRQSPREIATLIEKICYGGTSAFE